MDFYRRVLMAGWTTLLLVGCVNVPPDSIAVNGRVSSGITTMEQNTVSVIKAWRDTAVALLEAQFDDIYDRAEEKFRSKRNIPGGQTLTSDQVRDVAVLVMVVNDAVRDKIDARAAEMRQVSQNNAAAIKAANDSITGLLKSAQAVIGGRDVLIQDVTNLLPIPANVVDFVKDAKEAALNPL